MNENERRLAAIRRVAQGESISRVCNELGRTRAWYHKWRSRYRQGGVSGLKDRRPGHSGPRTTERIQELVVEVRDRLVREAETGEHALGIGADEIARELRVLGVTPPSRQTIYTILKRFGRTAPNAQTCGYRQRPAATQANAVHQLDLWPRMLTGGIPLFLIHLVDVASWYPCGQVSDNKTTDTLLSFLLSSWQHLGVPQTLQLDNEMSFTGGRWAPCLGRLTRLALLLGCEVWFNPFPHALL